MCSLFNSCSRFSSCCAVAAPHPLTLKLELPQLVLLSTSGAICPACPNFLFQSFHALGRVRTGPRARRHAAPLSSLWRFSSNAWRAQLHSLLLGLHPPRRPSSFRSFSSPSPSLNPALLAHSAVNLTCQPRRGTVFGQAKRVLDNVPAAGGQEKCVPPLSAASSRACARVPMALRRLPPAACPCAYVLGPGGCPAACLISAAAAGPALASAAVPIQWRVGGGGRVVGGRRARFEWAGTRYRRLSRWGRSTRFWPPSAS